MKTTKSLGTYLKDSIEYADLRYRFLVHCGENGVNPSKFKTIGHIWHTLNSVSHSFLFGLAEDLINLKADFDRQSFNPEEDF